MGIWGSGGYQRGRKRGEGPPPVEFCPPPKEPTPSLPTFSRIPEHTVEGHVLKPESGSRGGGRGRLGGRRGEWGRAREGSVCPTPIPSVLG